MHKIVLLVALLSQFLFALVEELVINTHKFTLETKSYDVEDTKGKYLKLYQDDKLLFRFTLKDETGACSAKSLIDGHYEIVDNQIKLYSFWNRRGKAYLVPYGARIQIYDILSSGEVKLSASRVYIEASKYKQDDDSGMKYLFKTPQNEAEKALLQSYILEIEKQYNATFVLGQEREALFEEVRSALKRKMQSTWKR